MGTHCAGQAGCDKPCGWKAVTMPSEMNASSSQSQAGSEIEAAWHAALAGEILSANPSYDLPLLQRLVHLYEELHYEEHAIHLMTRSLKSQLANPQVMTLMLELLVRQRALNKLAPVVSLASRFGNRAGPLRLALATAYSELGQIAQATTEWVLLLAEPTIDPSIWRPLASFLTRHGDVHEIGEKLDRLRWLLQSPNPDPYALYCLLRVQMDRPLSDTDTLLHCIPPNSLDDPEIQLSLAIIAFRLGAYARARTEIERAQSLKPDFRVASNILRTVDSFAGRNVQGMPRVSFQPRFLDAASSEANRTAPDCYSWGWMRVNTSNQIEAEVVQFTAMEERLLEFPSNSGVMATFSILPNSPRPPHQSSRWCDPLEVLPFIDWSVPHVMVQRRDGKPMVHAFVGSPDHRDWYWYEVSLKMNAVEFQVPPSVSAQEEIWRAARQEIKGRATEEDR